MPENIYTIQLDTDALNSFFSAATHASHAYQMGQADRPTCEAIWDFGEHLIDAIEDNPETTPSDVFRLALGYNDATPTVDLPSDVVDSYLQALTSLNTADAAHHTNPYQDALDAFRRNEEALRMG